MSSGDQRSGRRRVIGLLVLAATLVGLLWWLRGRDAAIEGEDATPTADDPQAVALAGPRDRPLPTLEPRPARGAAITGTITDRQARPIADAQVCAVARAPRLASSDRRGAVCVRSGRDGRYRIGELFGVPHMVVASAAGFIPEAYRRGEGSRRRDFVDVRPAQESTGIDLALAGGGVEIRGVVKDLSGGAVEGAQVIAGNAITHAGVDGSFSLWVRPGEVTAVASADGYAGGSESGAAPGHAFEVFLTPESVLIGKVVRVADGSPVEGALVRPVGNGGWDEPTAYTDAGGNFRVDRLLPGPFTVTAESDEIFGRAAAQVVLGLGETSAVIVVQAHPAFYVEGDIAIAGGGDECDDGRVYLNDKAAARNATATRDADGSYRARGLLPGDYEVRVNCPGFAPQERYDHVIVADRSVTGVQWQMSRGQAIRGVVVDADGRPVARLGLRATAKPDPDRPRAHLPAPWPSETDELGRFAVLGVLPGDYMLRVNAWSPPRAVPTTPIDVKVPASGDLEDVKITLPGTGEVKGSVRDARGRGLARITVSLYDGVQGQDTLTADDGSFRFPHVAAAEYRVLAARGWSETLRAPGTGDDDVQGAKVRVRAGGVEQVALVVEARAAKISGVVRDADGGPVADAFIEATRESTSAASAAGGALRDGRWSGYFDTPRLTDPDGRFTLEGLSDGKHTVRAHRKGGGEAFAEHVEPGADVVLTIAATGRMSGTVTTRDGAPLEEFTVRIVDESSGFGRNDQFFRTGGAWSFAELPAGKYKIRVGAGPGSAETEASMTAGADTTGVRIELTPKVTVRGVVLDLEGEPAAGLTVTVRGGATWASGDEQLRNVTDAAGRYEVVHAPIGQVTLRVAPRNWQGAEFDGASLPMKIDTNEPVVELPAIRVTRRRTADGEAPGDFGHVLKDPDPGADPLQRRHIVAVVRPGSPAAIAGLKPADEIVTVDGHDVTGANAYLMSSLTRVPAGTAVSFGLAGGTAVVITAAQRP